VRNKNQVLRKNEHDVEKQTRPRAMTAKQETPHNDAAQLEPLLISRWIVNWPLRVIGAFTVIVIATVVIIINANILELT
jgi:hypothetical protein